MRFCPPDHGRQRLSPMWVEIALGRSRTRRLALVVPATPNGCTIYSGKRATVVGNLNCCRTERNHSRTGSDCTRPQQRDSGKTDAGVMLETVTSRWG